MLAGRIRRQPLVVIRFQGFQQGMFRVASHEATIGMGIEMSVLSDEHVILAVEPVTQIRHPAFVAVTLFFVEQFAQGIPNLDHAGQTQTRRLILDRQRVVIAFAKCGGGLEHDFPDLRLNAQSAHFQRLEIRAADELRVARPDLGVERVFFLRHETVRRKHVQAVSYFPSQIRMGRIGQAVQRSLEHAPEKASVPMTCRGCSTEIAVDGGLPPAAV